MGRLLDPFQGFWHNAEARPLTLPSTLKLAGLQEEVTITFDKHLIPHVKAANTEDLYFAQGYITAFHRLWQMDFHTRIAAGRLSEIVGPLALKFDRLQRRKGLSFAAKNALLAIKKDADSWRQLTAYVAGVNAYIDRLPQRNWPVEYKLLAYSPERWTPSKTTLLYALLGDSMSGKDTALEYTNALHLLGRRKFDLLFPDFYKNCEPIVPLKKFPFEAKKINTPPFRIGEAIPHAMLPQVRRRGGSNNWAVARQKTTTGAPLLASDPHLEPRLPCLWYLIHLASPTVNVLGASIPGAPAVLIGANVHAAWGVTNSLANQRDWYAIEFSDDSRTAYHYNDELLKTQIIQEEIKVKGKDPFIEPVVYTHLGPIVYDAAFTGHKSTSVSKRPYNLAMKYMGHHPGNLHRAIYLLNQATNYATFNQALSSWDAPGLNFCFAAANNDIAMVVAGKYPAKWPEQGKFILPGDNSAYRWQGYIPYKHNPKWKNPPQGFLSSANQHPTGRQYPYYLRREFCQHDYRHRRINQVLRTKQKVSVKDMMALQNDTYNLKAAEALPTLLSYLEPTKMSNLQQAAYQQLKDWDLYNNVTAVAPSIFAAWEKNFHAALWKELLDSPYKCYTPSYHTTISLIKDKSKHTYLKWGEYTSLQQLLQATFSQTVASLEAWEQKNGRSYAWGYYRKLPLPHIFTAFTSFGRDNVLMGGADETVNANKTDWGVSLRFIAELDKKEKLTKVWLSYPGGQPGNPGNPCYTQLLGGWQKGKYISKQVPAEQPAGKPFHTLTIAPKPSKK